jgi:hypothetical protein
VGGFTTNLNLIGKRREEKRRDIEGGFNGKSV